MRDTKQDFEGALDILNVDKKQSDKYDLESFLAKYSSHVGFV